MRCRPRGDVRHQAVPRPAGTRDRGLGLRRDSGCGLQSGLYSEDPLVKLRADVLAEPRVGLGANQFLRGGRRHQAAAVQVVAGRPSMQGSERSGPTAWDAWRALGEITRACGWGEGKAVATGASPSQAKGELEDCPGRRIRGCMFVESSASCAPRWAEGRDIPPRPPVRVSHWISKWTGRAGQPPEELACRWWQTYRDGYLQGIGARQGWTLESGGEIGGFRPSRPGRQRWGFIVSS